MAPQNLILLVYLVLKRGILNFQKQTWFFTFDQRQTILMKIIEIKLFFLQNVKVSYKNRLFYFFTLLFYILY